MKIDLTEKRCVTKCCKNVKNKKDMKRSYKGKKCKNNNGVYRKETSCYGHTNHDLVR